MAPPETMYCAQQINIPPELPDILKEFTKAAIRTQPHDVLAWSAAYFNALANGEPLPVKRRLEPGATGLTPGLLDVLHQQLKDKSIVALDFLTKKWTDLGLPKEQLSEIIRAGSFAEEVEFDKFFAVACSHLGGGSISDAMRIVCQILTLDPDGGASRIQFDTFKSLYQYLASLSGEISQAQIDGVIGHLQEDVDKQGGMVMPRNFLSPECPKLS
ncbi:ropporin-1-like protein [Clavelina lepadiformis]|uniref:Ropporin-1-like protein n=1 Tax=Clavelina lepadiformis TaxID=159417 RepID=A0ABP0F2W0_CLALP